jgi:chromosome segregation ATPase
LSSISSTGANQYGWQQKLQMAQRNADQAEQEARALRQQANQAQRAADRAERDASTLGVQADQADLRAGKVKQGVAALKTQQQSFSQLSNTVDQVLGRQKSSPATTQSSKPAPVVNTQGQVTGTTINTTA